MEHTVCSRHAHALPAEARPSLFNKGNWPGQTTSILEVNTALARHTKKTPQKKKGFWGATKIK